MTKCFRDPIYQNDDGKWYFKDLVYVYGPYETREETCKGLEEYRDKVFKI